MIAVPGTPSEAVELGLCPMCLGTGETFHVVEGVDGPCSGCGGLATLDALLAHQCTDPTCPDHHPWISDEVDEAERDTAPTGAGAGVWTEASSTAAGVELPNLCGMFGLSWDGPCVLSGGHFGPCYGAGDVGDDACTSDEVDEAHDA